MDTQIQILTEIKINKRTENSGMITLIGVFFTLHHSRHVSGQKKKFPISFFCSSTSNCTLQDCYLCEIGCKPPIAGLTSENSLTPLNLFYPLPSG